MQFFEKLNQRAQHSLLCVGLDPNFEQMPEDWPQNEAGIYDFCRRIIDATAEFAAAFKPQMAYFSALGFERALYDLIAYIHATYPQISVILDGKRGDIADTAKQYAKEAFERYEADAATVNLYMGADTLAPWLEYTDNGVFVLCKTSNPGSADLQNYKSEQDQTIYEQVACLVEQHNAKKQCGLVVGATFPEDIARIRQSAPHLPFLMPGAGHQGANIEKALRAGAVNAQSPCVLVNSSRAILYASRNAKNFDQAAHLAAESTFKAIEAARQKI